MLLEFKIEGNEIRKIHNCYATKKDSIYKCKFYFQRSTWGDEDIYVTFINSFNYSTTQHIGRWQDILYCTVPTRILKGSYFKLFVHSKSSLRTNKVSIDITNYSSTIKVSNDVLNDLLKELSNKIDAISYEDQQLKCYANGKLVDVLVIDNVDDEYLKTRIQQEFEEYESIIDEKLKNFLTEDSITFENGIIYINRSL